MNISQIIRDDTANGTGIRLSVFVSGCTRHCPGCFNEEAWDFSYGRRLTKEMLREISAELAKPWYDGLTILGGEPFEPENQQGVYSLVRTARKHTPDKTIWIYTGCTFEDELRPGGRYSTKYTDGILGNTDILVDGPYIHEQRDLALPFRGSSNQRILDMKTTLREGRAVEVEY